MKKTLLTLFLMAAMLMPGVSAASNLATLINPLTLHRKAVVVGTPNVFKGGYVLETKEIYEEMFGDSDNLGAVKPFRPSGYETTLSSSLAEEGSETTLVVNSLTLPDGTTLDDANYGDLLILTVGEGDSEEKIAVGTLAESTLTFTIISRGLEYGRWASSTSNMKQHLPGERVYVSNDDAFLYQQYYSLDADETATGDNTFTGTVTFTGEVKVPTPLSSATDNAASVEYVNDVATSGAANLSTTVKGIAEGATQAEMAAGTNLGATGAELVLKSQYATSTRQATGNHALITDTSNYIDPSLIDMSDSWTRTGQTIFSGTTTLSNITIGHNVVALTASTTITGATLPQPVYIATSTNASAGGVLLCDGNVQDTLAFTGFAVTSATDGNTVYVQTDGIVNGFTGLTKGAKYYVSDTVGTIQTAVGTYEVLVGTAISATEILMQKGNFEYMGSVTVANNASVAIHPSARFLIIEAVLVDTSSSECGGKGTLTLNNPGNSASTLQHKCWTGGGGIDANSTFTWSGTTLSTNNSDLSGNATVYMYR